MDLFQRIKSFWFSGSSARRSSLLFCTIEMVFDGIQACLSLKETLFVNYMMNITFITPYMLPLVTAHFYKHLYNTAFYTVRVGLSTLMIIGIAKSNKKLLVPWILSACVLGVMYFISDISNLINLRSSLDILILQILKFGFDTVVRCYFITFACTYYRELGGYVPFRNPS